MAKILFMNRCFWPDTEATGLLLTELAEDLAASHEVSVICGPANTSARRIWPLLNHDSHGLVRMVRTGGMKLSKRNLLLRLLNLAVYFLLAAIAALRQPADIIVAETDPPMLGALGAILKKLRGCCFVYYCQDLYPDIAEATAGLRNPLLLWCLRGASAFAYRHADAIVVLSEDMAARLRRKGVPAERITIIPNWIDCEKVKPLANPVLLRKPEDAFVVMYAGSLGWPQKLESVLQTAHLMRDDGRVKFVLVGEGARKSALEDTARRARLVNVHFIERQPPSVMSEILATGNLHLIPLAAGAAGCLVPSKVYWTLAAGKPFVAIMDREAEVARLAREFEVGFVAPPSDPAALAKVISEAIDNPDSLKQMGYRGRRLAEQEYDRRRVTRRFAQFLAAIVPSTRPFGAAEVRDEV